MAIQQLTPKIVPFQQYLNQTANLTAATSTNLSFVNDGYTILVVQNGQAGATNTVIVSSVADNAGREDENLGETGYAIPATQTAIFGTFRPIWWNQAGQVFFTLSTITSTNVGVFKLQF